VSCWWKDHDEVRRLLADIIQELGHEVECVTTGRKARLRLSPGSPKLVITDVCLPDGSGYQISELAEALGITAVLMSGHPDETDLVQLPKPFSLVQRHQELTPWRHQELTPLNVSLFDWWDCFSAPTWFRCGVARSCGQAWPQATGAAGAMRA
jgi:CheY-like chemotaxis protein